MGSNWAAKKEISAVSHPSEVIMPILCLFRSRQRTLCRQLRFVGFAFSALKMSSMAQLTEVQAVVRRPDDPNFEREIHYVKANSTVLL
jgi:hypothetical protein